MVALSIIAVNERPPDNIFVVIPQAFKKQQKFIFSLTVLSWKAEKMPFGKNVDRE